MNEKELREKIKELEDTPFYLSEEGYPNPVLYFSWILAYFLRKAKIKSLKNQLKNK